MRKSVSCDVPVIQFKKNPLLKETIEDRGWTIEDRGWMIEDRVSTNCLPPSIFYPPFPILYLLSSIFYLLSSIFYPLSSILNLSSVSRDIDQLRLFARAEFVSFPRH